MCWSNIEGAETFDSNKAKQIGEKTRLYFEDI